MHKVIVEFSFNLVTSQNALAAKNVKFSPAHLVMCREFLSSVYYYTQLNFIESFKKGSNFSLLLLQS